jgi:hypothetical protein
MRHAHALGCCLQSRAESEGALGSARKEPPASLSESTTVLFVVFLTSVESMQSRSCWMFWACADIAAAGQLGLGQPFCVTQTQTQRTSGASQSLGVLAA